MKEKHMLLCLMTIALVAIAAIAPASAQITAKTWLNPAFLGVDDSTGASNMVGYVEGTNWNLSLLWSNTNSYQVNVSAIRVLFEWDKNYTWRYSTPIAVKAHTTQTFNVYNTTPSVKEVPEYIAYDYIVYIDNVNSTTAPFKETSITAGFEPPSFEVLSADHLACLNIIAKYSASGGIPSIFTSSDITRVDFLLKQADQEYEQGHTLFMNRAYGSAKPHLESADSLYTQALNAWNIIGSNRENVTTNNEIAMGSAALNISYAWMFFGIGWILIGIGVIVYGARRSMGQQKQQQASPPTQ
jgi:hypothetical protein